MLIFPHPARAGLLIIAAFASTCPPLRDYQVFIWQTRKLSVRVRSVRLILENFRNGALIMTEFLLLYRGSERVNATLSPQQMQDYLQHFQSWIMSLTRA